MIETCVAYAGHSWTVHHTFSFVLRMLCSQHRDVCFSVAFVKVCEQGEVVWAQEWEGYFFLVSSFLYICFLLLRLWVLCFAWSWTFCLYLLVLLGFKRCANLWLAVASDLAYCSCLLVGCVGLNGSLICVCALHGFYCFICLRFAGLFKFFYFCLWDAWVVWFCCDIHALWV